VGLLGRDPLQRRGLLSGLEKDLESSGVDLHQVGPFQLSGWVCETAMDDGDGSCHQASQTHGL
jgi:hypothetical protein